MDCRLDTERRFFCLLDRVFQKSTKMRIIEHIRHLSRCSSQVFCQSAQVIFERTCLVDYWHGFVSKNCQLVGGTDSLIDPL